MRKLCALLVALSVLMPVLVFADGYSGPFCFESKSMTGPDEMSDPNNLRGTCKQIDIEDVITLDPALQNTYFIGLHNPMPICEGPPCTDFTKFSETMTIYSSSTVTVSPMDYFGPSNSSNQPDYVPTEVAVFDRSFFLPILINQFQQNHMNFSQSNFPPININVYDQGEVSKVGYLLMPQDPPTSTDMLHVGYGNYYYLDTFSSTEYGKHIWAPKADLIESQYADLYKNDKAATSKDLGISYEYDHNRAIPTVSIVDPLDSITNYWMYSLKNGKIAMIWQKTDYALDDGTIKRVAPSSNGNVTSIHPATSTTSTIATTTLATTTVASTSQPVEPAVITKASTTAVIPAVQEKNIFQRIWDAIVSWF